MRIIPTRVGTSIHQCLILLFKMDHPHACGDKFCKIYCMKSIIGSSPRVWGQESVSVICKLKIGIIPTRVGTRYKKSVIQTDGGDHPHACGDKFNSRDFMNKNAGSSPRVWGQVVETKLNTAGARIIPTRVGTSAPRMAYNADGEDHPHACGDKYNSKRR